MGAGAGAGAEVPGGPAVPGRAPSLPPRRSPACCPACLRSDPMAGAAEGPSAGAAEGPLAGAAAGAPASSSGFSDTTSDSQDGPDGLARGQSEWPGLHLSIARGGRCGGQGPELIECALRAQRTGSSGRGDRRSEDKERGQLENRYGCWTPGEEGFTCRLPACLLSCISLFAPEGKD